MCATKSGAFCVSANGLRRRRRVPDWGRGKPDDYLAPFEKKNTLQKRELLILVSRKGTPNTACSASRKLPTKCDAGTLNL
jgi:hypothetical protein